jgi:integrase
MLGESGRAIDPLAQIRLPALSQQHFAAWRDRRMALVSSATVRREWNFLASICTTAVKEWRWLPAHPMHGVTLPPAPPPRTRRISDDEIERILHACGYVRDASPDTAQAMVGLVFLFAIETAMRAGEICALKWSDVDLAGRVARVRAEDLGARKTLTGRTVPLSVEAVRLIGQVPRKDGGTLFGITSASLDALFRKAKARALVDGLHFHDSRREALTRMAAKVDVLTLAKISGHKDLRILSTVYYAPDMGEVAGKLG